MNLYVSVSHNTVDATGVIIPNNPQFGNGAAFGVAAMARDFDGFLCNPFSVLCGL